MKIIIVLMLLVYISGCGAPAQLKGNEQSFLGKASTVYYLPEEDSNVIDFSNRMVQGMTMTMMKWVEPTAETSSNNLNITPDYIVFSEAVINPTREKEDNSGLVGVRNSYASYCQGVGGVSVKKYSKGWRRLGGAYVRKYSKGGHEASSTQRNAKLFFSCLGKNGDVLFFVRVENAQTVENREEVTHNYITLIKPTNSPKNLNYMAEIKRNGYVATALEK